MGIIFFNILGASKYKPITNIGGLYDTVITCEDNVTLLGVNIDFTLNFNDHISDICKKASQQLAVLKRIGRF